MNNATPVQAQTNSKPPRSPLLRSGLSRTCLHPSGAALIVLAAAFTASAQTNLFYNKGEIVAEFAPTYSLPKGTFGCSFETEYWESTWTGTGLEFGSYNSTVTTYGILDHTAVMQDFRYAPFPASSYFSRLAIGGKTGAETVITTGAKNIELGASLYWTFGTHHSGWLTPLNYSRLELNLMQHQAITGNAGEQTVKFSWQILF